MPVRNILSRAHHFLLFFFRNCLRNRALKRLDCTWPGSKRSFEFIVAVSMCSDCWEPADYELIRNGDTSDTGNPEELAFKSNACNNR
jgi:hypothetical protein